MIHGDELGAFLDDVLADPAALAAFNRANVTLLPRWCVAGNCVELIDTCTGENTGGWGPVGCVCQEEG